MRKPNTYYNLFTENSFLAAQWHPTKNKDLLPQNVLPKSNKKVWWICEFGHEWQATIVSRSCGTNCPYCAHQMPTKEYNLAVLFPEISLEWDYRKNGNITPYDVCPKSDKKVWWICPNGHEWLWAVKYKTIFKNCPYCTNKRASEDYNLSVLYPDLIMQWHPTKNKPYEPNKLLPKSNKKIWWICKFGHEWLTSISHRTDGEQCPYCVHRKTTKDYNLNALFPELAKEWNTSRNGSVNPEDVSPYSNKKFWWKCLKGHEWQSIVSNRTSGKNGCPECALSTVSKLCINWLDLLGVPNDVTHREVSLKIEGKSYIVDGFDPTTNTIYEFLGDFWHGNPSIYCLSDLNVKCKKTFGDLYLKTQNRFKTFYKNGFKIIYKWESSHETIEWSGSFNNNR